ncbi:hypothetical protein LTR28_000013, partial [Elasticomyces elasticus]
MHEMDSPSPKGYFAPRSHHKHARSISYELESPHSIPELPGSCHTHRLTCAGTAFAYFAVAPAARVGFGLEAPALACATYIRVACAGLSETGSARCCGLGHPGAWGSK